MKSKDSKKNQKTGFLYQLEPRVMLDAAAVATGAEVVLDAKTKEVADSILLDASVSSIQTDEKETIDDLLRVATDSTNNTQSIVVIDSNVDDYKLLIDGLDSSVKVILINDKTDGLEQINTILADNPNIASLHIVSHGGSANLELAGESIDFNNLTDSQQQSLADIGSKLDSSADILIYGCEFGSGESGKDAVAALSELTGADIAASDDLTGSISLDADWDFEVTKGDVSSTVIFNDVVQSNFTITLDADDFRKSEGYSQHYDGTLVGDKWIKGPSDIDAIDTKIDTVGKHEFNLTNTYSAEFTPISGNGDHSVSIIGFSSALTEQSNIADLDNELTDIDFGIFYEYGIAFAYVNGDMSDRVAMIGDSFKIEVNSSTGLISFYMDGSDVAEVNSADDFSNSYYADSSNHVFSAAFKQSGDGVDNVVLDGYVDTDVPTIPPVNPGEYSGTVNKSTTNYSSVMVHEQGSITGDKWFKESSGNDSFDGFVDSRDHFHFSNDNEKGNYSVEFNILFVDDESESATIIGFTDLNSAQPGTSNLYAGTTDIDVGVFHEDGQVYAFANGAFDGSGDRVYLGNSSSTYKIEVDTSTNTVNYYVDGILTENSFELFDYRISAEETVLDMAFYGAGDGFDNLIVNSQIKTSVMISTGELINGGNSEGFLSGLQYAKGIDSGDLDGSSDGLDLDIVVAESVGNIVIYRNEGDSNFTREVQDLGRDFDKSFYDFKDVEVADLDGDGDLDIVGCSMGTQDNNAAIVLGINDGTGIFSWEVVDITTGNSNDHYKDAPNFFNSISAGNFDETRKDHLDIAINDFANDQIIIFKDVVDQIESDEYLVISTGDKPYVLETIESGSDDSTDFIISGTRGGEVVIYDPSTQEAVNTLVTGGGKFTNIEVIQDSSGNGYAAATSRNNYSGSAYVWSINPDSANLVTNNSVIELDMDRPSAVSFIDIDSDSDLDLVVASYDKNVAPETYTNGTGSISGGFNSNSRGEYVSNISGVLDMISANLSGSKTNSITDLNNISPSHIFFTQIGDNVDLPFVNHVFQNSSFYNTFIKEGSYVNIVPDNIISHDYAEAITIELTSGFDLDKDTLLLHGTVLHLTDGSSGDISDDLVYLVAGEQLVIKLKSDDNSMTSDRVLREVKNLEFLTSGDTGERVFTFLSTDGDSYVSTINVVSES